MNAATLPMLQLRCYFMRDIITSKKIGYKQAFKAVTFGLCIAYIIMALMGGPFWLFQFDYAPTILFAVVVIYVVSYFIGGLTGVWILQRNRPAILIGILSGFLIVWAATFMGSLIGFVTQGLANNSTISEAVYDYIYKPIGLVTIFGFLPIILVGIWFGLTIKKNGAKALNV